MLVFVRARADLPFDPRFFRADPLFWPIARAAEAFARDEGWPSVETYSRAFAADAPVRFEAAPAVPRRRRGGVNPARLYDARITRDGCVPTRPRSWHDFLNALVWATFPRSKRALHARQLGALTANLGPAARRLPPARSREHDALALIDEGGVVVLDDGDRREVVLFGHALYEGLVLGRGAMTACEIPAPVMAVPADAEARVALADEALAARLVEGPLEPEGFGRVRLAGRSAPPS
jgi:hypothetical protein